MPDPAIRIARDYNAGLAAPVRWIHVGLAIVFAATRPLWTWAREPGRRAWALPLVCGVLAFAALLPFDGVLSRAGQWIGANLGGDPRRELFAIQQYGQFTVSAILALVVFLLDPKNRARLQDWVAAWLIAATIVYPMKILVGRPRPRFGDGSLHADVFLGPFGAWPLGVRGNGEPRGVRHAWELWAPISSDLWAMPSSHTAYAFVLSTVLARMYPAISGLLMGLAMTVGFCRVLFGGHWASDVAIGAAIGIAAGTLAMDRRLGQRALARWTTGRQPPPVTSGLSAVAKGAKATGEIPAPPSPAAQAP